VKVFITGASSGIGAALARAYAERGATCTLVARRAEVLESLRQSLPRPESHRIDAIDVNEDGALARVALEHLVERGVPDIVIANAGISGGTDTSRPGDLAAFQRIIETNVVATAATFTPFLAAMKREPASPGGRRLVAIASVAGIRGLPGSGAYSASKAAVITYAESLRVELRGSTVRVVTIAPGFIDTPMTKHNPYPMPFLMPVDAFAARAIDAISAGTSYRVIPWQMAWVARGLRLVPNALFDAAFARAGRKPPFSE
jgi:short-subunit dehydrogenase